MRDGSGRIVLMNFGAGEIRRERSGAGPAGTPLYLAPELFDGTPATIARATCRRGRPVLPFHLVTQARYPVEGTTLERIAAAHARRERHHLAELSGRAYNSFSAIVERAARAIPRPAAIATATRCSGIWWRWCTSWTRRRYYGPAPRPIGEDGLGCRPAVKNENLGPDRNLRYLANGLADELLTGLGKVPGLRLVQRSSTAPAARVDTDIRLLCRRLGVDAAIEGAVRK